MEKVWLVTGSSRGLGRKIVEEALQAGDVVVATARDVSTLDDLSARYPGAVLAVPLDVTDASAVAGAVQAGLDRFGRYDVVVNNAGYANIAAVEDSAIDDFRAQVETNFFGVVHVSKAVLPILRSQGSGHLFQVSSLGGRIATCGLSAYQSAKWAVGGFSSALAQEVAPFGIQVTVLEPGGMETDWAGSSMHIPPVSPPYEATVGAFIGMLRGMAGQAASDPRKVARVIVALANRPDAPLRLLLGEDAVAYAGHAQAALAASDAAWLATSVAVAADRTAP